MTTPRKLSEITREFSGLQAKIRNHAAGTPGHADIMARVTAIKAELASALPPLTSDAATQAREKFIRSVVQAIDAADRDAVNADVMAERSPHMAAKAAEHRKMAATLRRGLDAAGHTDSDWWVVTAGDAQNVARGLAGESGFLRSRPR